MNTHHRHDHRPTSSSSSTKRCDLPSAWREHTSRTTGRVYYYNEKTDESTYEMPAELRRNRKRRWSSDETWDADEHELSMTRQKGRRTLRAQKRGRRDGPSAPLVETSSPSRDGIETPKMYGVLPRAEKPSRRRRASLSDAVPDVDSVSSNPHILQVLQSKCGYESRTDIPFDRVLSPDAPRAKYRRRKGEVKTVIHWGQRKLFMSELEFLTMYAVPDATVVYAGAAPGTHTKYLIELFPELKFVLVDPAPFSSKLSEGPRCLLRQELFTDEIAREFEDLHNVLFICDIRSCDWSIMSDAAVADKVLEDMQSQQRWHDIIKPIKSMLKFRLPWAPGQTEYLAGDVYLQAFGPITTTETRLIPHGHERTMWDNKKYEEQMFHFNTVTRVARYPHKMHVGRRGHGIDYCYDCRAEIHILTQFLRKTNPELSEEELKAQVCVMTARCSRACASNRTLMDANSDPDEKTKGIRRRQWIRGKPAYHEDNVNPSIVEPVYSDKAEAMMAKMGYKKGSGLGAQGQGIAQPIEESKQFRRRGVGFDAKKDLKRKVAKQESAPKS